LTIGSQGAIAPAAALPLISIFAMPKAFRGHFGIIQRNAITSWTLLKPKVQVFLFGDDQGTAEIARELGLRHIPDVARCKTGAPRIDDIFAKAEEAVPDGLLCYVNADIMLMDDFRRAAEHAATMSPMLMIGRRWDTDITDSWDFQAPDWQDQLRIVAQTRGRQAPSIAIDYFLFTKGLGLDILPLALGRGLWDHWLVANARRKGAAVLDASACVTAVHQNHDYSHHPEGREGVWSGEDARQNRRLIGPFYRMLTIADASHRLTSDGIERRYFYRWHKIMRVLLRFWRRPRTVFEIVQWWATNLPKR
jgi:hypothetical protein